METPQTASFSLCGGHPVLDFVNTLDNRFREGAADELLASYGDLLRFAEQSRLLSVGQVRQLTRAVGAEPAARALSSGLELREALAAVLYGSLDGAPPSSSVIRTLKRHFLSATRHRELRWVSPQKGSGETPRMAWDWGSPAKDPALPVWHLALEASQLMTSESMSRLRSCECETCRWLFLDTSKNHSRRWCDMKVCGNRMKARRFQARRDHHL